MRQEAVKTAVSRFAELPAMQRSVVILKDVLDESLMEIAALLDLTVDAVKGHLARGRARLREINAQAGALPDARPASAAMSAMSPPTQSWRWRRTPSQRATAPCTDNARRSGLL